MWPLTNGNRCLVGPEADLFRGAVGMMIDQLVLELNETDDCVDDDLDDIDELLLSGERDHVSAFEPPHWYAMWEPGQKVWLLERVATSLLTSKPAPAMAAMFEATVEAVYVEVGDLIAIEIMAGEAIEAGSWRRLLLDAYVQRCPHDSFMEASHFEATTLDSCLPPSIEKQLDQIGWTSDSSAPPDSQLSESVSPGQNPPARQRDWLSWWSLVIDRLLDATYGPRVHHAAEAYRDGDMQLLREFLQSKGVSSQFVQRIPPLRTRGQTQAAIDRLQAIVFE